MKPTHVAALFAVAWSLLAASSNRLGAAGADNTVTYIASAETTAAFAKGRPLIETTAYKVHASRREAPGRSEVHALDTDIFYILEGSATIVTGGQVADLKETAPNERLGGAIQGGTSQHLAKGDVFIVPNGVPHQFTEVTPPFLYYTVKVTGR